jgi:MFS family permease
MKLNMFDGPLTEYFIQACFISIAVLTASLFVSNRIRANQHPTSTTSQITSLTYRYLGAYLLAMLADWLQGPYVYALYAAYGFDRRTNGLLFVCGFGSSMVFGTVVGSLADKFGRRRFTLLYCVLYALACLSKHFASFYVLLAGRVAGGISTSLLFSVFDSWLCSEHKVITASKDGDSLAEIFTKAQFGNSLVAVTAGLLAQWVSDLTPMRPVAIGVYVGGFTLPFDCAMIALAAAFVVVLLFWRENYGDHATAKDTTKTDRSSSGLLLGLRAVLGNISILKLLIQCASFEASMYIFVFMWTPALTAGLEHTRLPFGLMFATFMTACMLGTQIFGRGWVGLKGCLALACAAHLVVLYGGDQPKAKLLAFLLFETAVGIYFPAAGTKKAQVVPDSLRASIYSLFRVPLNVIVVGTLIGGLGVDGAFTLTSGLLAVASVVAWL